MNWLDAMYVPLAVVTAPWWARKARSGWGERFGKIERIERTPGAMDAGAKRVLVHAVSVGEVNTLRGLVPMLTAMGHEVVVSASTDTGLARARALYAEMERVWVVRYPLDFSPAVERFLDAVRPDAVALVELEVWPNFVRACARRRIPVGVINGRLSARSFRGYARLRRFFRPTFAALARVGAQDEAYAERFVHMGVEPSRCAVTGSMKWDAAAVLEPGESLPGARELAEQMGIDLSRPVIVAGSTAPMEASAGAAFDCEEALLSAAVDAHCPKGTQLVCAPRKPEHVQRALAAMGGAGRCVRRSEKQAAPAGTDRFLLDTIGELRQAYALADVVVVGRTFGKLGGSDPIEPIALGKATVCGPGFANFETITRAFVEAGAIRVARAADVGAAIAELLKSESVREAIAEAGRACIAQHRGATSAHARLIDELLQRAANARV